MQPCFCPRITPGISMTVSATHVSFVRKSLRQYREGGGRYKIRTNSYRLREIQATSVLEIWAKQGD